MPARPAILTACRRRAAAGVRGPAFMAPGLTLLEVVLAVVMLSLVSAAITSAIATVESMNEKARRLTAAHELAHRLVLTWLDDQERMPTETLPLDYGPYQFMWEKEESPVRMEINDAQRSNSASVPQALGRFRLITIRVFEAAGDPRQPYPGGELASLSRLYDPAAARNPESSRNITKGGNLERLLQILTGQDIPVDRGGSNRRGRDRGNDE